MLYFDSINNNIFCIINTMGNFFSYIPNKSSTIYTNNITSEYKLDYECATKIDEQINKPPKIVEPMERINSYDKFDSFDSSPIVYNKLLDHLPVNGYKCCNCYTIVNTKLSHSYHAIDRMWCYSCWKKKLWEY